MLVVEILGGLGNQMFQYASGLALARRSAVPLKLDVTAFEHYTLHRYSLPTLLVTAEAANVNERMRAAAEGLALFEAHFHYDAQHERTVDMAYMRGYWQSERYFAPVRPQLLEEFAPAEALNEADSRVIGEMEDTVSVMIHIRRGDYVTDPGANSVHGVMPMDYYRRGVEHIISRLDEQERAKLRYFVFSDDPAWVREAMAWLNPTTFVDHNSAERNYMDLHLMSRANHHLIANSSFSWWGAWLCQRPGQIVVAPQRWFQTDKLDTQDLIPKRWTRL